MSLIAFGDLFTFIRNGMSVKQDKSGDGLPITRIETISNGTIDPKRVGYAGLTLDKANSWLLKPGDILFSHINSVEHIGKCAVYEGEPHSLVHGMNLLCLRPDPTRIDSGFCKWLIRSDEFRTRLSNFINKAVNQASVSIGNLRTIKVHVPSLEEQRRIAAILDQAEVLRAKRRQALAKVDTLTQSLFLEMFGDPSTNSKGWKMFALGEIGNIITGNTPSRASSGYFGAAIDWIKSDNVNTPHYYVTRSAEGLSEEGKKVGRTVPAGSILVTCIAGSPSCIGNAAMSDREVAFNQQLNAIVPLRGDPHFLYAQVIAAKSKIQEASTKGMKGIVTKSRFEKIQLMFPPLALQEDFSRTSEKLRRMKEQAENHLAFTNNLVASLQHRAFRGEL